MSRFRKFTKCISDFIKTPEPITLAGIYEPRYREHITNISQKLEQLQKYYIYRRGILYIDSTNIPLTVFPQKPLCLGINDIQNYFLELNIYENPDNVGIYPAGLLSRNPEYRLFYGEEYTGDIATGVYSLKNKEEYMSVYIDVNGIKCAGEYSNNPYEMLNNALNDVNSLLENIVI